MALSATPSKLIFFQENTQAVNILGLQDALTGNFLNAATVSITLQDGDGNQVTGCISVPLNYIVGSNGNYTGSFGDSNFTPDIGTGYTLVVEGNQSGNYVHVEMLVEIKARQR